MPVPGINRAVVQAVNVGLSIDPNVQAVLISDEPEEAARDPQALGEAAARGPAGHRRVAVPGARRAAPVVPRRPRPGAGRPTRSSPITFVVIPEYVARSWWERILYNQSAKRLRAALLGPAAHGRGQRAVPARGAVRGDRGAADAATDSGRRPTPPPAPPRLRPGVIGSRPMERARRVAVAPPPRRRGPRGSPACSSPGHGGDLTAFVTVGGGRRASTASAATTRAAATRTTRRCCTCCGRSASRSTAASSRSRSGCCRFPFDLALGALLFNVVAARPAADRDGLARGGLLPAQPGRHHVRPDLGPGRRHGRAADGRGDRRGGAGPDRCSPASLAVLAGLIKPQFGIAGFVLAGLALFWLRSPEGIRRVARPRALGARDVRGRPVPRSG